MGDPVGVVVKLTPLQEAFKEEYLIDFNGTQAAIRAGYSPHTAAQQASRLLKNVNIQEAIKARISEKSMCADEVLIRLAEQARSDLGVFFKIVEEWTFYPLSTYDILDAQEVEDTTDPDHPRKRISYLARHIAIDTDKLADPRYSHLLHKMSESPKDGVGIELYSKQAALVKLAQIHGLLKDKTEITGKDGGPIEHAVTLSWRDLVEQARKESNPQENEEREQS